MDTWNSLSYTKNHTQSYISHIFYVFSQLAKIQALLSLFISTLHPTLIAPSMSEQDLALLIRHYSALSPSTPNLIPSPPFPSSPFLSLPSTQQYLVSNLITRDPVSSDEAMGGGRQWKKSFWKRIVRGIEEGFEIRSSRGDRGVEEEVSLF